VPCRLPRVRGISYPSTSTSTSTTTTYLFFFYFFDFFTFFHLHLSTMTTVHKFGVQPISCHAWSGDRKQVAMCHSSKEVAVYGEGQGWARQATLDQHDLRVTGIDWAPRTNRIVTCSSDRNAYVWVKQEDGTWKHTLVLLRINRAATCVRWSPQENKFAVGSGAKIVSICYYETGMDWWVAKHIKKPLKSTVTCLDWHPNNYLLACGSTDFKVRVYSGFIKDIEEKPSETPWGKKMPIGQVMGEFSNSPAGGGWVHGVSFSADGGRLAWVSHDSSISVADAKNGMAVQRVALNLLPFLSVTWAGPSTILAVGHNCVPIAFTLDDQGNIGPGVRLEEDKEKDVGKNQSAMSMFQNKTKMGQDEGVTKLNTTHQSQIVEVRHHTGDKASPSTLSTVAGDGKLVLWDLAAIRMKGLKI